MSSCRKIACVFQALAEDQKQPQSLQTDKQTATKIDWKKIPPTPAHLQRDYSRYTQLPAPEYEILLLRSVLNISHELAFKIVKSNVTYDLDDPDDVNFLSDLIDDGFFN